MSVSHNECYGAAAAARCSRQCHSTANLVRRVQSNVINGSQTLIDYALASLKIKRFRLG